MWTYRNRPYLTSIYPDINVRIALRVVSPNIGLPEHAGERSALGLGCLQCRQLANDAVRAQRAEELELAPPRGFRAVVGQDYDLALPWTLNQWAPERQRSKSTRRG